ncbi:MAG: hypothetical protein ABIP56_10040 [Dokdonella sp.]
MRSWISTLRPWLVEPERRRLLIGFLLLAIALWELQYAVRYIYQVPVWDLAALHETLLGRIEIQTHRTVWDVAVNFVVNGHWPLIPFFAYYADFAFDNASGRIPMVLSWMALIGIAVTLAWSMRSRGKPIAILVALALSILVLWPAQMESVISPMQVLISLSLLFGILALRTAAADDSWRSVVATFILVLASIFSFGYGVVLWPTLLILFGLKRRWLHVAITLLLSVLVVYVYQRNTVGNGLIPLRAIFAAPWDVMGYTLAQAGAFFAYLVQQSFPAVAQLAGALIVAVHGALTWHLWRSSRWSDRSICFLWLVSLWLIGMMLLTGLGRHSLGPDQAMNTRYLIVSSLYWASLFLLGWRLIEDKRLQWRRSLIASAFMALIALLLGMPTYVDRMRAVQSNQRLATLALTVGVVETDAQGRANSALHPWSLQHLYEYFRRERMTIYREDWSTWIGSDFATRFGKAVPRRCQFAQDLRTKFRGGDRLIGWIYSPDTREAPTHALFVDAGKIVGAGFVMMDRPEVATFLSDELALRSGYYGYVPESANDVVNVYGRFDDGSICAAGSLLPRAIEPAAP